ncbi:glycosyltransferase family 39 protein [Isosphaeraceae bacterium EP7]
MGNSTDRARASGRLLAILTIVGLAIRLSGQGRLYLDQFDEGIYALGGLWSLPGAGLTSLDPTLIPYAPPVFPILVGLAYEIVGVSDLAAILPSLIAGTLTIIVVGLIAWRSFGVAAGVASATLAAFSGAHAEFSRVALTDATFLLTWLLALFAGQRFLSHPGVRRAILLGLATGLAWNTKYNGFLAGVIVVLAAAWNACLDSEARRRATLARVFGFGAIAGLVAILAYIPWAIFVERNGGYAALAAHQRSYLGGPISWFPHWRLQLAQSVALSGPPIRGILAWIAAFALSAFVSKGEIIPRRVPALTGIWNFSPVVVGALAAWLAPDFGWWAGLFLMPRALFESRPSVRLLALAWLVPAILTPFYHPYARLWLPIHAAGWLLIGGAIGDLVTRDDEGWKAAELQVLWKHPGLLLTVACLLAVSHWQIYGPRPRPLIPPAAGGRGLALLPKFVLDRLGGARLPVRVLARPPALFYLGSSGINPGRLSGIEDLTAARLSPGLVLVDEAVLDPVQASAFLRDEEGVAVTMQFEPLRPVTMLDVDPSAAYRLTARRPYRVFVLDSRRTAPHP